MERLRFMEGTWRGQGWWQRGPAQRDTSSMVETVERKLGGVALLIEGRGVNAAERVVHNALAVLSYDAASQDYTMRSWITNGQVGDFVVTLNGTELSWTRPASGGRVRNTARYTATEWNEVGEFSRDGVTWMPIMEIRLRKQP